MGKLLNPYAFADNFGETPAALIILATAEAWWENDYSGNTKSGTVTTWADKTANANNLTQGTSGNRPTDGGAYADFDGVDDWLGIVAANATAKLENPFASPGATLCCVVAPDSDGETDAGLIYDHGQNEGLHTVLESVGSLQFQLRTKYQVTTGTVTSTSAFALATVHIIFIRCNKSDGNTGQVWNINGPTNLTIAGGGLTNTTANSGSVFAPGTDMFVGSQSNGQVSYDGKIYAKVWWPTKLSDANVATVGAYFATKYSGTWA